MQSQKSSTRPGFGRPYARWALAALFCLGLILVAAPSQVLATDPTWVGEYYNNTWLGGAPVQIRNDPEVNFDWGSGSPGPGVNADNFSARWTRAITFGAGNYVFTVTTDDGARLWVDNTLVLDKWFDQAAAAYQAQVALTAGDHNLRLEYYEHFGVAVARLSWAQLPLPCSGWQGEYFANMTFSGTPAMTRCDPVVGFFWGSDSPGAGVPADQFSVRWTRTVPFTAGTYIFSATHDDGIRVWIDDQLAIDAWFDTAETTATVSRYLGQGDHRLRVEYYEHFGVAVAAVRWDPASAPPPPPPPTGTLVVDNLSPSFQRGGPASGWHASSCGYFGHTFWTPNATYQIQNYAIWTPMLPQPGTYSVYVFVPRCSATTSNAQYKITHAGAVDAVSVNQLIYSDVWIRLGTFAFSANGTENVFLGDATGEAYLSRRVGFDAVKFVLEGFAPPPACSILPQLGFGQIWFGNAAVRAKVGCALAPEFSVGAAEEVFIGGITFWREDIRRIYVLYNSGAWQSFADTWDASQPESDPSIVAPAGYFQPVRGFGKVWRVNPQVRWALSWARAPEVGLRLAWEDFNGGAMLWSSNLGSFVLFDDGTWMRP